MYEHNRNDRDLAEGTRIRITANGEESKRYLSVGAIGTIQRKDNDGDYRVEFDSGYRAFVSDGGDEHMKEEYDCYAEFEVLDGQ